MIALLSRHQEVYKTFQDTGKKMEALAGAVQEVLRTTGMAKTDVVIDEID